VGKHTFPIYFQHCLLSRRGLRTAGIAKCLWEGEFRDGRTPRRGMLMHSCFEQTKRGRRENFSSLLPWVLKAKGQGIIPPQGQTWHLRFLSLCCYEVKGFGQSNNFVSSKIVQPLKKYQNILLESATVSPILFPYIQINCMPQRISIHDFNLFKSLLTQFQIKIYTKIKASRRDVTEYQGKYVGPHY
jgi:hypothetical protein